MNPDVLLRYNQKIQLYCSGIDPYHLAASNEPIPRNLHYFDICNYCIGKDSAYTHESLRAFKTLESFKLYESGWVQSVSCKKIKLTSIIVATVKHSYRINEKPLKCWVAIDKDGVISTAHCSCMAGLGEVCSHIGAVLFMVEDWGRLSQKLQNPETISCTDVLAKWLVPTTKQVEMASIDDIDWGKNSVRIADDADSSLLDDSVFDLSSANVSRFFSDSMEPLEGEGGGEESENVEQSADVENEIDAFLHKIHAEGVFCPIMAMREPFANFFVEAAPDELLKKKRTDDDEYNLSVINLFLPSMFKPAYEQLSLEDLREISKDIQLTYTADEIEFIESKTRDQSLSKLWFRFRAGRVTGSTFKKVCRTQLEAPSIDTIEQICFPERKIFKSKHTSYGKENEPVARGLYADTRRKDHTNFMIRESGLVINNDYPFCGASPDAIVSCDCCGAGSVEIKCPSTLQHGNIQGYLSKKGCPLVAKDNDDGTSSYELKQNHEYYYQCQMQMFVTEAEYCDFVVWQPENRKNTPTIILRIYKDELFWMDNYAKASAFFEKVILPELLGCYYTNKRKASTLRVK